MTSGQWLLLAVLSLIWGGSFFFVEVALVALPPVLLALLRVAPAVLVLLGWCLWRGLKLPNSHRDWLALAVMGLLNNALPFVLIAQGQVGITGGLASILNATTAFFAVLAGALFVAGEELTPARLGGVALGILGVVVVIGPDALGGLSFADSGQLLVLLAAMSYALAGVWGRRNLGHLPPAVSSFGMLLVSTLMLGAAVLVQLSQQQLDLPAVAAAVLANPSVIWAMLGLSIGGTAVAYLFYFQLLNTAGPSRLLLVTIIVPVFAVTLDAAVLGQLVTAREALGAAVVLLGLLVMDGRLWRRLRGQPA